MSLTLQNIRVETELRTLLDDVSIEVLEGELVGVIGPNGAGKSTLLSVAAGLQSYKHGSVVLKGRRLEDISEIERAQSMAWLKQDGEIHWPLTVERVVALGRTPHVLKSGVAEKDHSIVEAVMRQTDCIALRDRDVTTLSGGERARVLLARALAGEPTVLMADEPNAALDIGHQLQSMDLLQDYARAGNACLLVLHDLTLAARYCDRLYLLERGKLVAHGKPMEVLTEENLRQVYHVEADISAQNIPSVVAIKRV